MKLAFLTSTPLEVARGSGTYAGIGTLARALESRGDEVEFFTPQVHCPVYTLERLVFNEQLRFRDLSRFDAVVGFDMDGYRVGGRRHIASIKGVIADEMRFERGLTRRTMAIQAACERRHVRRADLVMTTSGYAAGRIEALYGIPRVQAIVPELIDLAAWRALFAAHAAAPDPAKFTVLSVCRFYPRKRLDVLLGAAARLRERIPELEVRIVGGGPEEPRLRAIWRERELQQTVRFLLDVSQAELAREYCRADVFCLPSVQEGFGIVLLEAMAAGKPIVAARAAAVPEVVPQGVLVEPESEAALAEALAGLHADAGRRGALGEECRRRVLEFDAPKVAELFVAAVRRTPSSAAGPLAGQS